MCDIWKRDTNRELPLASLDAHREALRSLKVRWVVLSGGEPLMHSSFPQLCKFFRELDIRVTLLTAGINLQKRAEEVAHNVDDVIVSLDGPKAIHDRVRGIKGAFDLLANGVVKLLSLRPELRISARTTVQRSNHESLCETIAAAQDLDLSGISFLAADLTSTAFNRNLPWSEQRQDELALNPREADSLEKEIASLIASYAREIESHYISESPAKLRRIVSHFRAHLGLASPEAPRCNAPWVSAVVGHDGAVQPCFFHPPIGNIHLQSLNDIVNSTSALKFRSSLIVAENPTCQRCVCSLHLASGDVE